MAGPASGQRPAASGSGQRPLPPGAGPVPVGRDFQCHSESGCVSRITIRSRRRVRDHLREVSIGEKQKLRNSSSEPESPRPLETQPAHWTESRRGLAHSTRLVGDKTDAVEDNLKVARCFKFSVRILNPKLGQPLSTRMKFL